MQKYRHVNYYFGEWKSNLQTIGFEKLDGSNIRFEYSRKRKKFYKFGSRQIAIAENDEAWGNAIRLFQEKYTEGISKVFEKHYRNVESFVCFAEYFGTKSKFGQHEDEDVFDIVLFDIHQYKKGLIRPEEFVDNFQHLHIPNIVYHGSLNKELFELVRQNKLPSFENKLKEGIICKSVVKQQPYYCKIKTQIWLDELKERYGENRLKEEFQ